MAQGDKKDLRHQKIKALLNKYESIELTELCSTLGCSESTIRNDLRYLESIGALIRTFGGAMRVTPASITLRSSDNQEEKKWIADYAFHHLIIHDSTVTLDSGSTCIELAIKISENNIPLNVVTTSFRAASYLVDKESITLNLVGGRYDSNLGSFYDENSIDIIKTMHSDIFFLAAKGVSPSVGYSITRASEACVKQTMINCAQKTVALLDHTKIGVAAFKLVCGLEKVDTIITDCLANRETVRELREKGCKVILVSENGLIEE